MSKIILIQKLKLLIIESDVYTQEIHLNSKINFSMGISSSKVNIPT